MLVQKPISMLFDKKAKSFVGRYEIYVKENNFKNYKDAFSTCIIQSPLFSRPDRV